MAVMLWSIDSATALKYNGYRIESLLIEHMDKGTVHGGEVYKVRECMLWVENLFN